MQCSEWHCTATPRKLLWGVGGSTKYWYVASEWRENIVLELTTKKGLRQTHLFGASQEKLYHTGVGTSSLDVSNSVLHSEDQCTSVYSVVQYSTMKYSILQCSTVQHCSIKWKNGFLKLNCCLCTFGHCVIFSCQGHIRLHGELSKYFGLFNLQLGHTTNYINQNNLAYPDYHTKIKHRRQRDTI